MNLKTTNESEENWPGRIRQHAQSLRRAFLGLSLLSRRQSNSPPSSSQTSTSSMMQQCLSTCEPDISIENTTYQRPLEPCKFCFEPVDSTLTTDLLHNSRGRQCSQPVNVPNQFTASPMHSPQHPHAQSQSSGYHSIFGNGLSPTTNYWTAGVNDYSSVSPSTEDNPLTDQDQSTYNGSSITDGPDEEHIDDGDITDDDDFEVLSFNAPPESTLYIKEFPHTTATEQNNLCACCSVPFSLISDASPRRCYYYGKLYCSRCHIADYAYIPAKIIKTFDARQYPVCRRAKSILQLHIYQPVFDIQHDNNQLYAVVPLLAEIKAVRTQFQYFYAFLSTCPRIERELQEKFFQDFHPRDHLYQSVHLYSLADLMSLRKVLSLLTLASKRAREHITTCLICCGKGFICEICKRRDDVLYSFEDSKRIARCDRCSNIYHRTCWENIDQDCPKCYRLIQRQYEQDDMNNAC